MNTKSKKTGICSLLDWCSDLDSPHSLVALEQKHEGGQEYVTRGSGLRFRHWCNFIDLNCLWNHSLSYILWVFCTGSWNLSIFQMVSRGQEEAKPCVENCVELSRAKTEHFASVWLVWVWGSASGNSRERMLRKGKDGSLQKLSALEVVHSSGLVSILTPCQDLSRALIIFLIVTCILKWNSMWNWEFTARVYYCILLLSCQLWCRHSVYVQVDV